LSVSSFSFLSMLIGPQPGSTIAYSDLSNMIFYSSGIHSRKPAISAWARLRPPGAGAGFFRAPSRGAPGPGHPSPLPAAETCSAGGRNLEPTGRRPPEGRRYRARSPGRGGARSRI
jgi:hypothetical protein